MILSGYRPYLFLVLIGVSLYAWTAFFDFSFFDDQSLIIENQHIIGDFSNLGKLFIDDAFFSNQNFYYRPILNLSLMFDSFLVGTSPWLFHLVNVVWHLLAGVLLLAVLSQLGVSKERSFFWSVFFLVHPALVQAVAWIPGRNDLILTVFALSSFLFFLRYLEKPKLKNYIACFFFFTVALFTKEAAIVLPFLFIVYYLFISLYKISKLERWLFVWSALASIIFWFFLRQLAIDGDLGGLKAIIMTVLSNSAAAIIGLGKLFFPFNLAIMPILHDVTILYGLAAVSILVFLGIKKAIPKTWLVFGLMWFIAFLLPSFISPNPEEFYYLLLLEHRLYLPFIGLIFIFSQLNLKALKFGSFFTNNVWRYLAVFILIVFVSLSARHLPHFSNRLTFWRFAVDRSPNSPLAQRNLGAMLYFEGRLDEAVIAYRRSLEINPYERMAHNNLGVIHLDRKEYDEAEAEFKQELLINPGYETTLMNLERLLILKNQLR